MYRCHLITRLSRANHGWSGKNAAFWANWWNISRGFLGKSCVLPYDQRETPGLNVKPAKPRVWNLVVVTSITSGHVRAARGESRLEKSSRGMATEDSIPFHSMTSCQAKRWCACTIPHRMPSTLAVFGMVKSWFQNSFHTPASMMPQFYFLFPSGTMDDVQKRLSRPTISHQRPEKLGRNVAGMCTFGILWYLWIQQ